MKVWDMGGGLVAFDATCVEVSEELDRRASFALRLLDATAWAEENGEAMVPTALAAALALEESREGGLRSLPLDAIRMALPEGSRKALEGLMGCVRDCLAYCVEQAWPMDASGARISRQQRREVVRAARRAIARYNARLAGRQAGPEVRAVLTQSDDGQWVAVA